MKKIFVSIITLLISFMCIIGEKINASTEESQTIEQQIEDLVNSYLNENNVEKIEDLDQQTVINLVNEVEAIKERDQSNFLDNSQITTYATSTTFTGYVFATLDSKTAGFPHGHAGIGGYASNSVIEANPGDGVKQYSNRVNGYWRTTSSGGIYGVKGASASKYQTATNYAQKQIGKAYGFNPVSNGDFYCSELVFYAWESAGYDLDYNRKWGELIMPAYFMIDLDLYVREKF